MVPGRSIGEFFTGRELKDLANFSTDSGVIAATAAFKTAIQSGSSKEIDQALKDLRTTFNDNISLLDDAGKAKLSKEYKKIVDVANS